MRRLSRWLFRRTVAPATRRSRPFKPTVLPLEDRVVPARPLPLPVIAAAPNLGSGPVKLFDADTGAELWSVDPFPGLQFGTRIALADFTRDGYPDLAAAPGPGAGPVVTVLDGKTGLPVPGPLGSFFAFDPAFRGGVTVAAGDFTGDGVPDVAAAADAGGGPHVRVFDGQTGLEVSSFFAFEPEFAGGVRLAAGKFDGTGATQLVLAAGVGGGPRVKVVDLFGNPLASPVGDFFAFETPYWGGVHVSAGDVTGDGQDDVIVGAGLFHSPEVRVFDGATGALVWSKQAFGAAAVGGVTVGAAYVDDDEMADVVAGSGPGVSAQVVTLSGATGKQVVGPAGSFAPGVGGFLGVRVAAANDPPSLTVSLSTSSPTHPTINAIGEHAKIPPMVPNSPIAVGIVGVLFGDTTVTFDMAITPGPFEGAVPDDYKFYNPGGVNDRVPGKGVSVTFSQPSWPPGGQAISTSLLFWYAAIQDDLKEPDEFFTATISNLKATGFTPTLGTPSGTVKIIGETRPAVSDLVSGNCGCTICRTGGGGAQPAGGRGAAPAAPLGGTGPSNTLGGGNPGGGLDGGQTYGNGQGSAPPSGTPATSTPRPVRYADGAVTLDATDLGSAGGGMPWGVTRSWSNRPGYSYGNQYGAGWVSSSLPTLVSVGTSVAAVLDGTTGWYFDKSGSAYVERHFRGASLTYDSGAGVFTLTDGAGTAAAFYDFSTARPPYQRGGLKAFTDPAGNSITVTAYDAQGRAAELQRTFGTTTESYLYAYGTAGPAEELLETVTLRRKVGAGSWSAVRSVGYEYYDLGEANGNAGDLKRATIRDGAGAILDQNYYRYYQPGEANGYARGLKFAFGSASYARLKAAVGGTDANADAAANSAVDDYLDHYYEYDSQQRVTKEIAAGDGCSACTGGQGTYTLTYSTSGFSNGFNNWKTKTVVTLPDGTTQTVFANYRGQVMLKAHTSGAQTWYDFYRYDSNGQAVLHAGPSAVTGYNQSSPDLVQYSGANAFYLADSAGLVTVYAYYTSTTATSSTPGGALGYLQSEAIRRGEGGTDVPQALWTYFSRTVGSATSFPVAAETVYRNDNGTGTHTTTYSYTWHSGSFQAESVTTTLPAVTTGQNGSGSAIAYTVVYDAKGRPVWAKDGDGFLTYTEYDDVTGAVTKAIRDVNVASTGDFSNLPSGWTTPANGGFHLISTFQVDSLGRTTKSTDPEGRVNYTMYKDSTHEVRSYTWDTTAGARIGATMLVREDRANGYTETLSMSATPTTSGGVPTGTEAVSGIQSLARSYRNAAGQTVYSDAYFSLTGVTYSTAANIGTPEHALLPQRIRVHPRRPAEQDGVARGHHLSDRVRRPGPAGQRVGRHRRRADHRVLVGHEPGRHGHGEGAGVRVRQRRGGRQPVDKGHGISGTGRAGAGDAVLPRLARPDRGGEGGRRGQRIDERESTHHVHRVRQPRAGGGHGTVRRGCRHDHVHQRGAEPPEFEPAPGQVHDRVRRDRPGLPVQDVQRGSEHRVGVLQRADHGRVVRRAGARDQGGIARRAGREEHVRRGRSADGRVPIGWGRGFDLRGRPERDRGHRAVPGRVPVRQERAGHPGHDQGADARRHRDRGAGHQLHPAAGQKELPDGLLRRGRPADRERGRGHQRRGRIYAPGERPGPVGQRIGDIVHV